jgi:hypothetical protein
VIFSIPIAGRPIFIGCVVRDWMLPVKPRLLVRHANGATYDYTGLRLNCWQDGDRTLFLVCPD